MARRRLALVIVAVVVLVAGAVALYVRDRVQSIWSDLRAVAGLRLPDGYEVVDRQEQGHAFCIITCPGEGEAAIILEVVGPPDADPCHDLAPVWDAEPPDPADGFAHACLHGPLPEITGGKGFVTVDRPFPRLPERPTARVWLSSGID